MTPRTFWDSAHWITRLLLLPPTAVFALIARQFLMHPLQAAAGRGIMLQSNVAVTVARVGFGAFPLGCSLFLVSCLVSKHRLLIGLWFVAVMDSVLLTVRILGMYADSSVAQSFKLVYAEIVLFVITSAGLFLEQKRQAAFRVHQERNHATTA